VVVVPADLENVCVDWMGKVESLGISHQKVEVAVATRHQSIAMVAMEMGAHIRHEQIA
jgi:hypothetical protein